MENSSTIIGPRGLIKKYEFVRVIVQCLYSLGYQKSASCLESESGVSYKSKEFEQLELQILNGDWDGCIDTLIAITDLNDERRASVLFLVFKQCFLEYLNRGDDSLALNVLRKRVSSLQMSKDKVHNLASSILCLEEMDVGKIDEGVVFDLRNRLLMELERLIPPPDVVPERRLEHLVETAVTSQIDSCMYHNSSAAISLYEDLCCGRDQIPTETVQAKMLLVLLFQSQACIHKRRIRAFTVHYLVKQMELSNLYLCVLSYQIYIWNRRNSKPIEILSGHSMTVNCVSWNLKGLRCWHQLVMITQSVSGDQANRKRYSL